MRVESLLVLALIAAGTPTPNASRSVPPGPWGGRGIALTVEDSGAKIEMDCAHGRITGRLVLDADGRFELPGTFTRERPGPVHMGPNGEAQEEKGEPARYSGRVEGDALRVSIRLESGGREMGPFELQAGTTPRLHKCL